MALQDQPAIPVYDIQSQATELRAGLTPVQQGMLAESLTSASSRTNLQQHVCRLSHNFDLAAMRQAWELSHQRHEVLRTSFRWRDRPDPVQVVSSTVALPFFVHDWSHIDDPEAELTAWLNRDSDVGIDLTSPTYHRVNVFLVDASLTIVVWTFHHAILDGRGATLVLEEVFSTYDGIIAEADLTLDTPVPFFDHVDALEHRDRQGDINYFSQLLEGMAAATPLPIGRINRDLASNHHREIEKTLPPDVVEGLARLTNRTDTTVYTCVLAAWALVLARYTESDDVVFGTTRSGRHTVPGASNIVGCLLNTVPARVKVDDQAPIGQLLRSIRADQVAVRPHEHTPLNDIQHLLGPVHGHDLLQSNVVFERYSVNNRLQSRGGLWTLRSFELVQQGAFTLTLAGYLDDDLRLCIEYNTGMFDPDMVAAMLGHVAAVLTAFATAQPTDLLGAIQITSPAERAKLRDAHPPTPAPETTYPTLFADSVKRRASATAVVELSSATSLTYTELDASSNKVAHLLRSMGIGADDRVALYLPRSLDFVVACLGVLKAGAAYVPMDPSYPAAVQEHILSDSQARAVVTTGALGAQLHNDQTQQPIVFMDANDQLADQPDTAVDVSEIAPHDLAYVIYTSGSTGVPKGVMVHHSALVSHNQAFRDLTDLNASDNVLQFASLSFDVSVEDMLPTLLAGATISLRSDAMAESMSAFQDAVEAHGITVLNLPSAFWLEWVHAMDRRNRGVPPSVRLAIAGGEQVSAPGYATWARIAPEVRWINGYGPTECAITCAAFEAKAAQSSFGELSIEVPIGKPTNNARAYVVDTRGDLAPIGVAGELWVGGPCVARGYLGMPDLTAERFVPDPFQHASDQLVYRTGDRVRWLPSGDLEFLGRIDRQIKLRGFRIEPAAVERALESHPDVSRAVVDLRDMPAGANLVGWVLREPGTEPDTEEIAGRTAEKLPSHMVPDYLHEVDHLPTKAGGKIDVAALPTPKAAAAPTTRRPANDQLERSVAAAFAEALGCETVDTQASFFDLGGHSLRAIHLLDRLEDELGQRVTLPTLHSAPSVVELSHLLRSGDTADQFEYLLPIHPHGTNTPIFGVHVLGKNGEYFRPLAARLGSDQPVFGLGLSTLTPDVDAPTDVAEIAAAYRAELDRQVPEGPVALAAISLGSVVAMELAQQLRASGRDVSLLAMLDARGPGVSAPIDTSGRVQIHLENLREHGVGYFTEKVTSKATQLREKVGLRRIAIYERLGRQVPRSLRVLQFVHRNYESQFAYEIQPYDGPIAVFCAEEEQFWDPETKAQGLGWNTVATGPLYVEDVPGSHLSILEEPNVPVLAHKLAKLLNTHS